MTTKKAKTIPTKTLITKRKTNPRIKHTSFQTDRLNELKEALAKNSWPPIYRKDGKTFLYASSAGRCTRMLWYYLNEPDKAKSSVGSGLAILAAAGKDIHQRIQEVFSQSFLKQLFGVEERFRLEIAPGFYITGKKDGYWHDGEKIHFEIKTMSSSQFVYFKGKPVDDKYKAQSQLSMEATGAERTEFLFVRRSGSKVSTQFDKEEPVFFMRELKYDPKYTAELKEKLKAVLAPEAPPQLPSESFGEYTVAPTDCAYCPFLFHCRPKAKAGYTKKVKGETVLTLEPESKWDRLVVIEPMKEEKTA